MVRISSRYRDISVAPADQACLKKSVRQEKIKIIECVVEILLPRKFHADL